MAGTGPAPKPADQRARRNATFALVQLPAAGREGAAPTWPLGPDSKLAGRVEFLAGEVRRLEREVSDRVTTAAERRKLAKLRETLAVQRIIRRESMKAERGLWLQLWKTPQATQWEMLAWDREVAQYVRWKCRGESGDLDAAKEARQLADRLGLNPMSLMRLRWEISAPATTAAAAAGQQLSTTTGSRKRYANLRVVAPDADAG